MDKKQGISLVQKAVNMGDSAYEHFEYVAAVLVGMEAIAQASDVSAPEKLRKLEGSIKAALYLAQDGAGFVDAETETLKAVLLQGGKV